MGAGNVFEVDGYRRAEQVRFSLDAGQSRVWLEGREVFGRNWSLFLEPFPVAALASSHGANEERLIEIPADPGGYSQLIHGPVGHPGDGEFERWPIKCVRVRLHFQESACRIIVDGETRVGFSPFPYGKPSSLPPTSFCVQIELRGDELAALRASGH